MTERSRCYRKIKRTRSLSFSYYDKYTLERTKTISVPPSFLLHLEHWLKFVCLVLGHGSLSLPYFKLESTNRSFYYFEDRIKNVDRVMFLVFGPQQRYSKTLGAQGCASHLVRTLSTLPIICFFFLMQKIIFLIGF